MRMKTIFKLLSIILVLVGGHFILSSFISGAPLTPVPYKFPWRQAGLTERQAAAHLLSRFTYGATPGQIDAVVRQGLENWWAQQLAADLPDDSLEALLRPYDALQLSNEQVVNLYPRMGQVAKMAIRDGVVDKDSIKTDRKEYREMIRAYMAEKGVQAGTRVVPAIYLSEDPAGCLFEQSASGSHDGFLVQSLQCVDHQE